MRISTPGHLAMEVTLPKEPKPSPIHGIPLPQPLFNLQARSHRLSHPHQTVSVTINLVVSLTVMSLPKYGMRSRHSRARKSLRTTSTPMQKRSLSWKIRPTYSTISVLKETLSLTCRPKPLLRNSVQMLCYLSSGSRMPR